MPKNIAGFEYFEVEFNRQGEMNSDTQVSALSEFVSANDVTDLFVISHGWNNDMAEARQLYEDWLKSARAVLDDPHQALAGLKNRRFAVMAVLWPSKRFTDKELIPGGAAGLGGKIDERQLAKELDELKALFTEKEEKAAIDKAKKLLPKLGEQAQARKDFVEQIRSLVTKKAADAEDGSDQLLEQTPEELLANLAGPVKKPRATVDPEAGGAAGVRTRAPHGAADEGGAAGLGDFFGDIFGGVHNLLNFTTYYEMKARAGLVGAHGVNTVLRRLRSKRPALKLHLIGHSFGGRLMAAVADGPDHLSPLAIDSMSLLQAAFSHNGFAKKYHEGKDGFFRRVIEEKRIRGPLIITHTKNDSAVGTAYPLASRLNRVDAAGLGDANDRFGGIGRNGAQKTPGADFGKLLPVGEAYSFKLSSIYNLNGDKFIQSHGDIAGKEVAQATLFAVAAT